MGDKMNFSPVMEAEYEVSVGCGRDLPVLRSENGDTRGRQIVVAALRILLETTRIFVSLGLELSRRQ